jgi:hypothetical protein
MAAIKTTKPPQFTTSRAPKIVCPKCRADINIEPGMAGCIKTGETMLHHDCGATLVCDEIVVETTWVWSVV